MAQRNVVISNMSHDTEPSPQPPEALTGIEVGQPAGHAAGVAAVASSFRHILMRSGVVRGVEGMLAMNQKDGFDCPSCAWPDPDGHRAAFEFCENGAKALASETTLARVTPEFMAEWSVTALAEQSDLWLDKAGRLCEPMVLRPGSAHYEAISWEEAFGLVAEELRLLATPDEALFYTSGRASNEAAFLYQLFARVFGTNNLPDCSNMCHESSGAALNASIGVGKGTVTLEDLHGAETILIFGQNPGTNHPRMLSALQTAVRQGAEIIAVNTLREAGLSGFAHPQELGGMLGVSTPLATQFLQVKPNGDMALVRGMAKVLLEDGVSDEDFIWRHTEGFAAWEAEVKATAWEEITELSGIAVEAIRLAARTAARGARKVISCWAMGLTQHRNAVATIQEVVNFHLLLGAVGRTAAGLCPVRGHSNVQGDRTMGIFEQMPESFHDALDAEFGFKSPRHHGLDTVAGILAMHAGKIGVFCALGGNFLQASPDTEFTAAALRRTRLTVHIATKLNRSHLVTGKTGLILPCLGRSEEDLRNGVPQFVTVENSMSVVHSSQGRLRPASPLLRSETAIVAGLAAAVLGERSGVRWEELAGEYDRIREHIERVVPGFTNFNERVRQPGGFYLPNEARRRVWRTTNGRAQFVANPLSAFRPAAGQLVLQTFRSHDQFNTTVYGLNDRYRGIGNERRIVFMNPDDMKERGIGKLQPVDLTSHWHDGERVLRRFLAVPYEVPSGHCAAYYPEANALVPVTSVAEISNTPTSKGVAVTIVPSVG